MQPEELLGLEEDNSYLRVGWAALLLGVVLGIWETVLIWRSGLAGTRPGQVALLIVAAILGHALVIAIATYLIELPLRLLGRRFYGRLAFVPAIGLALALLLGHGSSSDAPRPVPVGKGWNVVLITIDTLRWDSLGAYGHPLVKTPFLDALTRRAVTFCETICPVPMTTPSHASLLTGNLPAQHGAAGNAYRLGPQNESLAETLLACGYNTAAFVSCFPLDTRFGLDQGFLLYDDRFTPRGGFHELLLATWAELLLFRNRLERTADEVNRVALPWVERAGSSRCFGWFHYFDPHAPYTPPAPFRSFYEGDLHRYDGRLPPDVTFQKLQEAVGGDLPAQLDGDLPVERYLGEISYVDRQVELLFHRLADRQIYERSVIVVTADHGEGLGEHQEVYSHGAALYDPTIRVPLVIRWPELPKPRLVAPMVRLLDVVPSIRQLLTLQPAEGLNGESFIALATGAGEPDRPAIIENLGIIMMPGAVKQKGVRTRAWKLIQQEKALGNLCASSELFDLTQDPQERQNVCEQDEETARELQQQMLTVFAGALQHTGVPAVLDDAETIEKLQSLGYILKK